MTNPTNLTYCAEFDSLFQHQVFGLPALEKRAALMPVFNALHQHHLACSQTYARLTHGQPLSFRTPDELPYLAVRLFKHYSLSSVPDNEVFRVLQSSGTTSQSPAKVLLDKATSARQSKALVKIMQNFLGKQRLPMLIIDSPSVVKNKALSARAAGIQGMAFFGRQPVYALNEDMSLNSVAIEAFQRQYHAGPVLVFGFTFMVWEYFVRALQIAKQRLSMTNATLIHSGGWKTLVDKQVDNPSFKQKVSEVLGIERVHNFYGMAEQVGTVFVECEHGFLHAPSLAEILIRCPYTLKLQKMGQSGLVQVLSSIPSSYPGYSLLTEDLGRILGEDDCLCGRKGKYFEILGRLPKTELRGCSDTMGAG
ncbi:acyl-protein synthetase [Alteromonas aestuariivivens]|uniref:Acyl-protein synthetase n=1 Tax=Alteromonas aestuariivivens TaxID=1938339 RepID=A0A3D8M5U6_9ALTE|nr:acyl-protein synthetase [Alteromonas aestuariivivens]RDV25049.1 acyl-protein synthetase [Alteromonas aestuariivivens]